MIDNTGEKRIYKIYSPSRLGDNKSNKRRSQTFWDIGLCWGHGGGLGWFGALLSLDGWVDGVICLDKLGASVATTTAEWSYNLGQDNKEDKDKNCCCSSNHDACLGPGAVQPVGGVEPVGLVWKIIHYYLQFDQQNWSNLITIVSVTIVLADDYLLGNLMLWIWSLSQEKLCASPTQPMLINHYAVSPTHVDEHPSNHPHCSPNLIIITVQVLPMLMSRTGNRQNHPTGSEIEHFTKSHFKVSAQHRRHNKL